MNVAAVESFLIAIAPYCLVIPALVLGIQLICKSFNIGLLLISGVPLFIVLLWLF